MSINEYEVIIINDGSLDNSKIIIDEFCSNHVNFYSYSKENGGLSSARNYGIEKAKGEYLFFVDSDDFLKENSVKKILDIAYNEHLDCVAFDFQKISQTDKLLSINNYYKDTTVMSGVRFLIKNTIVSNCTRYLFKRKVLLDNNLSFTNGVYHEDEEFTVLFLSYVEKIKYINHLVYYYLQRDDSITTTNNELVNKQKLKDIISIVSNINQRKKQASKLLIEGLSKKTEQLLVSVFFRMKTLNFNYEQVGEIIKELERRKLYPLHIKVSNIKFKIAVLLFNSKMFLKLFYR